MCTHDFKVKLAINHFENSPKQLLVFLEELIKLGRIEALYVGVKNERKALSNKKLVEFLTEHDFENERFKLPKESVTLFPLFLIAIIDHTNSYLSFRISLCFDIGRLDNSLLHEVDVVRGVEGTSKF